ncbi:MAG: hypothetical protein ACP5QT_03720 [Brevinematia bacterium]
MNYIEFPKKQNRRKNPLDDFVLTSRVRISRNLDGLKFPLFLDEKTQMEIEEKVCEEIKSLCKDVEIQRIEQLSSQDLQVYLASKVLSDSFIKNSRVFCYQKNGNWVVLFNEEDHLKIFSVEFGYNIRNMYERINGFLTDLEERVEFAYDEEFGYLTTSILNVGTALRISVLVNLPGILYSGNLESFTRSLNEMSYSFKPFLNSNIPLFYIFNLYSLGISEEEIMNEFESLLINILKVEREMRENFIFGKKTEVGRIFDKCLKLNKIEKLTYPELVEYVSIFDLLNKHVFYVDDINYLRGLLFSGQDDYLRYKYGLDVDNLDEARLFLIHKIVGALKYKKAYI